MTENYHSISKGTITCRNSWPCIP